MADEVSTKRKSSKPLLLGERWSRLKERQIRVNIGLTTGEATTPSVQTYLISSWCGSFSTYRRKDNAQFRLKRLHNLRSAGKIRGSSLKRSGGSKIWDDLDESYVGTWEYEWRGVIRARRFLRE